MKDYSIWKDFSGDSLFNLYKSFKKTADRRLRRLRENDYSYPIETRDFLERVGRKQFPSLSRNDPQWKINSYFQEIVRFLENPRSTLSGINRVIKDRIINEIEKRLNYGREEKVQLNFNTAGQRRQFYNFLHSKQFSRLRKKIDSDLLIEDFYENIQEGSTADEIRNEYEKYLAEEKTYQDVQNILKENRNKGILWKK